MRLVTKRIRRIVAYATVAALGAAVPVALADNPPPTTTTTTTEPPPTLTLELVKPKPKPGIVTKRRFAIVVRATGPEGQTISLKLSSDQGHSPPVTRTGPSGTFSFPVHAGSQGGVYRFTVDATAGSLTAHLGLSYTVEPPVTAIQAWERGATLFAPGCSTCVIHDPRGDTRRGPPDIESATSTYRHGWVTITILTYDTVSAAHGRHPCVQAWTVPRTEPRNHWFGFGCQEGPHLGKIWSDGSCPHADAYGDCGSAHESFPNSHTTRYRFRPAQVGKIAAFYWQTLVEVSDQDIRDTVPNTFTLSSSGTNCWVKEQLVRQGPGAYSFGKSRCSQKGVVTKRP